MKLLVFGMGFTSKALIEELRPFTPGSIRGTTRSPNKTAAIRALGVDPRIFPGDDLAADIDWASHVLISAGPEDGHDPVLADLRDAFAAADLEWVGYLSTTGVYGDHQGGWVDETTPVAPSTARGRARVAAEAEWQALMKDHRLPLHIFRLPGIYGPGRGPFAKVRAGTARRIIKAGKVFGGVNVADTAHTLAASMRAPGSGAIYNIADDDPAPPQDVITYAAELLGVTLPPPVRFEDAEMTPMARSFYAESKRVDNRLIKEELGVRLRYPDYRSGLDALFAAEEGK